MEAKELRIGNYVYRQSSKLIVDKSSVYQIENVNLQSALKYEPISLTEEYILRFGFKHTGGGFYTHLPSLIQMCNVGDQFYNVGFKDANIGRLYHVHQLQNLYFALTGEELTLKK